MDIDITLKNETYEEIVLELSAYRALGTVEQLTKFAQAQQDGRLVVLPCQLGGTVYRICKFKRTKNWKKEAAFIRAVELNRNNLYRIVFGGELGKAVFLTRGEAEMALEQKENRPG